MEQICSNLSSFHQNKRYIYKTNPRSARNRTPQSKPSKTSFFSNILNWNSTPNKPSIRKKRSRSSLGSRKRSMMKKSKRTLQKSSLVSKSELRREYMKNHINLDQYNQVFSKARICTDKLNNWVTNSLPKWVAYQLLPLIIDLNMKNLRSLNDALAIFGFRLKEYELFFKYSEDVTSATHPLHSSKSTYGDNSLAFLGGPSSNDNFNYNSLQKRGAFSYENRDYDSTRRDIAYNNSSHALTGAGQVYASPRAQGNLRNYSSGPVSNSDGSKRLISLDEILSIQIRDLERFGDQRFSLQRGVNDKARTQNALRKLDAVILERRKLDTYLYTSGRSVDRIRLYMFKRMCEMANDQFSYQYDQTQILDEKLFPKDEEILLETFLKFVMQFDPFYKKVRVGEILQRSISALRVGQQPKGFFVKVGSSSGLGVCTGYQIYEYWQIYKLVIA